MTQPAQQAPRIPRYLKDGEITKLRKNIQDSHQTEAAADGAGRAAPVNRQEIVQGRRRAEKMLADQTPPDISPTERDRLKKRIEDNEKILQDGLPSQETMRRNPTGAVDQHLQWERRVSSQDGLNNKQRVAVWRADQKTLHKETFDTEHLDALCEVDRLRRVSDPVNYEDSQIRPTSMSVHLRDSNWDHPKALDWDTFSDASPARHNEQLQAKDQELEQALAEAESAKQELAAIKARSQPKGHQNKR